MSTIRITEKIKILLISVSLLSTFYFLSIGIFWLLSKVKPVPLKNVFLFLNLLFSSFIATSLLLLLFDNFTYTIFNFGIVSSYGLLRVGYTVFFLILFFISVRGVRNITFRMEVFFQRISNRSKTIFITILALFFVFVGVISTVTNLTGKNNANIASSSTNSPNIFIITADGVNAENMSVYGYERETTPFLKDMAKSSFVAQNDFTNSAHTSGSIISIYTSKLPVQTRVLYPPDILKSKDSYQHLAAILKGNGYYTAQFSFDHYVDAYKLNVQNGFDEANGRSNQNDLTNKINRFLPTNISYFIYELTNRLVDRIGHVFFIKKMTNPYLEIGTPVNYNDTEKFDALLELLKNTDKPIFAHIHWMGTHGPKYFPSQQVFSAGKDSQSQENKDIDFYDDSILAFDKAMSVFYQELESRNLLNNSIIIVGSDHGQSFVTNKRIPLIIRFPNGDFQKNEIKNVQNLDIAPTILDYIEIKKPEWMGGISLIDDIPENRPIFSMGMGNVVIEDGSINQQTMKPPFYQFGYVAVIKCDTLFRLNLTSFSWEEERITGYISNCDYKFTKNEAKELIITLFEKNNYDTTLIKNSD